METFSTHDGTIELRLGDYRDVLADGMCDAVICDPPYSKRTHQGHDAGASMANGYIRPGCGRPDTGRKRTELSYDAWGALDIQYLAEWSRAVNRGWIVALSDNVLCMDYRAEFEQVGYTGFHPLPLCIPGMTGGLLKLPE